MTEKTYTVAGVSTHKGQTKLRFANDVARVKVLAKNDHTDIDLLELPRAMTKTEIAQYFIEIDFADGRADVAAAISELASKFTVVAEAVQLADAPAETAESIEEHAESDVCAQEQEEPALF